MGEMWVSSWWAVGGKWAESENKIIPAVAAKQVEEEEKEAEEEEEWSKKLRNCDYISSLIW